MGCCRLCYNPFINIDAEQGGWSAIRIMSITPLKGTSSGAGQMLPPEDGNTKLKAKKIKPKWGKNLVSCGVFLIAFLAILVVFLGAALAKTGLVEVPLFSYLYHGPQPIRLVKGEAVTWDEFRIRLAGRIYEQRNRQTDVYTIQISEAEITGLLTSSVEGALRNTDWQPLVTQIAVSPSGMETFLKFKWRGYLNFDLLFVFEPKVDEQGDIYFEIKKTRFGDYPLPASWGRTIAGFVLSRDLGTWELKIAGEKAIKAISLLEKGINLIIDK